MDKRITIREAVTEQEVSFFWEKLRDYQERDIFPDLEEEDKEYFRGQEYAESIQKLHTREKNHCYYLLMRRDGQEVGFAMPVLYDQEDGKCFLLEFCVYPEFRGGGMGKSCAEAFLTWANAQQAAYVELNFGGLERRFRFWQSLGFLENGRDEWGEPLMILPPKTEKPVTVEIFKDSQDDWQLLKLLNSYLAEIGEETLSDEKAERLKKAIGGEKIFFFLAMRGSRAVGMCSVSLCFSTFACQAVGNFEDFYVEPVFRKKGIARKLAHAAQDWCGENKVSSLTVCCAPCDEEMYQDLGFAVRLGTTYAFLPNEND